MSRKKPNPKIRCRPARAHNRESSQERQRMARRAERTISREPPPTMQGSGAVIPSVSPQERKSPTEGMGLGERTLAWVKLALTGMWKQGPLRSLGKPAEG